jgi:hypothetical protein
MGYQYTLHQQKKQLLRERNEIRRWHKSAKAASRISWEERTNASHTGGNIDSTFLSVDEIGNVVPNTPEAALVAVQAYLLTTQPAPRNPREGMHQAAIKGLELIGDKLQHELSGQDKTPQGR